MKKQGRTTQRFYVRRMTAWTFCREEECQDLDECDHDLVHDVYEVYTQPRKDYLKARLFHLYDLFLTKSRIERVQDRVADFVHRNDEDPFDHMPPSVEHDCHCYSLDVRNQTVIGTVEIPREESAS